MPAPDCRRMCSSVYDHIHALYTAPLSPRSEPHAHAVRMMYMQDGVTPLHCVESAEVAKLLLDKRADVNQM